MQCSFKIILGKYLIMFWIIIQREKIENSILDFEEYIWIFTISLLIIIIFFNFNLHFRILIDAFISYLSEGG